MAVCLNSDQLDHWQVGVKWQADNSFQAQPSCIAGSTLKKLSLTPVTLTREQNSRTLNTEANFIQRIIHVCSRSPWKQIL